MPGLQDGEAGMSEPCQHLKTRTSTVTAAVLCEVCGEPVPGANFIAPYPPTWVPAAVLLARRKAEGNK